MNLQLLGTSKSWPRDVQLQLIGAIPTIDMAVVTMTLAEYLLKNGGV